MYERMHLLSEADKDRIHAASVKILDDMGINFHDPEAIDIFKHHGFKVDGITVHLQEKQIRQALSTVPAEFEVHSRNPKRNVTIGGDHLVLAPGYGASLMIDWDGNQRSGVMEDYDNFCRLVQTSDVIDMSGCLMIDPSDRLPGKAHLHMLKSIITLCDKPFIGSATSREAALDSMEMAGIAWGGKDQIKEKPVMIGMISSLSPLQYSAEMAGALIEYARHGQANMIGLLMMAGTTGPVTLPGLLVLQNAEMLAGIVLSQLVNPGAPVIYGSTSTVTDMRTGSLAIGAPELSMIQNATAQMAKYYKMPCRGSGGVTDSHCPDMQAGIESSLALTATIMSGANLILHACGILGSYQSMSFQKFLADEEICGMLRRMLKPLEVTEERLGLDTIKSVGIGNEYLTHPSTLAHCRTEFYQSGVMSREDFTTWREKGGKSLEDRLSETYAKRIQAYKQPDMDPNIAQDLERYVQLRTSQ